MSGVPNPTCTNCGKNLTTDDLRRTDCAYCGTLLPHHARAAQQVAVVQQMLGHMNVPPYGNVMPPHVQPMVAHYNHVGVQVAEQVNRSVRTTVIVIAAVLGGLMVLAILGVVVAFVLLAPR